MKDIFTRSELLEVVNALRILRNTEDQRDRIWEYGAEEEDLERAEEFFKIQKKNTLALLKVYGLEEDVLL